MNAQAFNVVVPLVKATKGADGKWWIHGVASDESLDLQGEITLADGLKPSLPYLRRFGKFNDDHKPVNVGEVVVAEVVSKGELAQRGIIDGSSLTEQERNQEVLYVGGPLYRHVDRARYYRDVLRSGGRLGLSIQGAVLEKAVQKSRGGIPVGINRRCFVNKIAVTDQPVNPNTWVALQKSFGGRRIMKAVAQALCTGHGIVGEGEIGGPALRTQSLEGASRRRKRKRREAENMNGLSIEKGLGGLSIETLKAKILSELNDPNRREVPTRYIEDLYEDRVIVSEDNKYYSYPYQVDTDGNIVLGQPVEVERVVEWQPVEDEKSTTEKSLNLGSLNTPVRIAKAWSRLTDPEFVADADPDEVEAAMRSVRDAAKEHGLTSALRDAGSGGSVIIKALSEADIATLMRLESMSDEEFNNMLSADIEALRKSKANTKKNEDEDEDLELEDEDEDEDEDLELEDEDEDEDEDLELEDEDEIPPVPTSRRKARKSLIEMLEEDADASEALDASPALAKSLDRFERTLEAMPSDLMKSLAAGVASGLEKALAPLMEKLEALSDLPTRLERLEKSNAAVRDELDQIGRIPAPAAGYRVLRRTDAEGEFSRDEAFAILKKAVDANLVPPSVITQAELGGIDQNLVKSLRDRLSVSK